MRTSLALLSLALPWLALASPAPAILAPSEGAQVHFTRPIFSGTAPPGTRVTLWLDGTTTSSATVDAAGFWSTLAWTTLDLSEHQLVVWASGDEGPSFATRRFTVASGPPDPPVLLVPAAGAELEPEGVVLAGRGEAGTTVRIVLDGTSPQGTTGAANVFENGLWSFAVPAPLAPGAHAVVLAAAVPGGSVGPVSQPVGFTVQGTSYYEFGCSASAGQGSAGLWALPLVALALATRRGRRARAILSAAAVAFALSGCGGGPTVTITAPENGASTGAAGVAVRGAASGDVQLVLVNGVPASSADGFQTWAATVPLVLGENTIVVTAHAADGRTARTSVAVDRYLALDAAAPSMDFTALRGQPGLASPAPGFPVSIVGQASRWRISGPSWLRFSQTAGQGPAVVTVTADAAGQPLGTLQSQVTVTDDDSGTSRTLPVSLLVRAAALTVLPRIRGSEAGLAFTVDGNTSPSGPSQALTISDELGGAVPSESVSWRVESISAPWVLLSTSSYRTSPQPQVSVAVDLQALAGLAPGQYEAQILLRWTNAERADQLASVLVALDLRTNPTFGASAPELSFAAIRGGTGPAQPAAGYPVSITGAFSRWRASGPSWVRLSATSGSGPATVTVTADATGLGYGAYAAPITVTDDASGQSRSFIAMLDDRAANPVLSPSSLSFLVDSLSPAAGLTRALTLSDELGGTVPAESVSWAVQAVSVPWLHVTPTAGGTAPASPLQVSVDLDALQGVPAGLYTASITFGWQNAQRSDQTLTVPVALDLRVNLVFGVTAPAMAFSAIRGSAPPAQPTAGFAVSIQGGLAQWRVTGPSWARFSAASGVGPSTVTVTADGTGLPYGVSTSQIVVSDAVSGQTRSFPVTFDNRAAALTVSPTYLGFVVDGLPPTSGLTRTLNISDELGGAVPAESVSWTVDLVTVPWLEVTPSGGGTSPAPQVSLNLRLSALSGFPVGQYTGDVMLRWSNAQRGGYVYLHVLLDVRVNLQFGATAPAMPFSAIRGSAPPASPAAGYPVSIQGGLARWRVTGPSWARFSAASGTGPATVTVTADGTGLPYGVSSSQVVVTDDDSRQSRSFPITFDNRAADLTVSPTSLSFLVDGLVPSTGTSRTLNISDELGSAVPAESVSWAVQSISVPWLTVTPASGGSSPAPQVSVNLNMDPLAGVPVGQYLGTIVLGWSNAQRANQTVTLTVSLDLRVNVVFGVVAPPMPFTAFHGGPPPAQPAAGYAITIVGGLAQWRVTGPSWARFSAASGTGGATVTVTADPTGLGYGASSSQVVVTDDVTGQSRSFPISLDVKAAGLVVSPTTVSFTVGNTTPASGLSAALSITDELGGAVPAESVSWSVQSASAPWLGVTPSSGGTAPGQPVTLALDPDRLVTMPPGHSSATITLAWSNAQRTGQTTSISVSLDLNLSLPNVEFASPYVGVAGQPGTLILRGRRFLSLGPVVTAFVGQTDVPGLAPDTDTQLRLSYPALPAGRYPVGIRTPGGLRGAAAELVVLPAPGYGYQVIPAPGVRKRMVWDAERQALYGINQTDQDVERYRFSGGAWVRDVPLVLPGLTDAALTPDGHKLIVLSSQGISDLDPGAPAWNPVLRVPLPYSSCSSPAFTQLAFGNDGRALVVTECDKSYLYDERSFTLTATPYPQGWFSHALEGASADGSRIYIGEKWVSPAQPVTIFDVLTATLTTGATTADLTAISVSGDASRVILQTAQVYNRSLTLTGNLGSGGVTTLASRDSSRAFVFRDDGGQPRLVIYDLNSALLPGANYPVARTILLPDSPRVTPGSSSPVSMSATHDDSVVFISGDARILAVPVVGETMLTVPYVDFASPYVGVANQPGSLILRGRNFLSQGGTVAAYIGGIELPGLVPESDLQLKLSYPALPAGRYPVGIHNPAGIVATDAELVVVPAPGFAYQAIPAPGGRQHLVWDAERASLYGINQVDQRIERYRFSSGAWVTDPSLGLPGLQDAALSTNGRLLLATSTAGVQEVRPDASPWAPTLRAPTPYINICDGPLTRIAFADNGNAMVTSRPAANCSTSKAYRYNTRDSTLAVSTTFYRGELAASADGSRIYLGSAGMSDWVKYFEPLTNALVTATTSYLLFDRASASGDGSRLILGNSVVYSSAVAQTGTLGTGNLGALASRDSATAFVYRDDGGLSRLVIYNLNGAPDSGSVYPVARTIFLPDSPNASPGRTVSMAASHDDSVVFISGDSKLLVVPVGP